MDHLKGLLNCLIYTYYTATIMLRVLKFLKRIYVSLIIKVKDFGSIFTKNSYFSISIDIEKYYINNIRIINSILYGILAILSYVFIHNTSITGFIVIFIFTIIFFSIFMYTSDNFKLSNNLFIKILQKFVFLIIKIALIVLFLNIFDISLLDKIFWESTNKLVSVINRLYEYLDTLSILQESSILHILLFTVLTVTVFNILSVLFGFELIKYFKVEERMPKLAGFFRLRAQFQRYYLIWNVSILFTVCLFGIIVNLLLFTVK